MSLFSRLKAVFFPSAAPRRSSSGLTTQDIEYACKNLRETHDTKWVFMLYLAFANAAKMPKKLLAECAGALTDFLASQKISARMNIFRECFPFHYTNQRADKEVWTPALDKVENAVPDEHLFAVLAVGTFHPSGYCRQQCLQRLERFGPKSLPYTLPLMNNWVKAVRDDARDISLRLIRSASAEDFLNALDGLNQIRRGSRRHNTIWLEVRREAQESLRRNGLTSILARKVDPEARRLLYLIVDETCVGDKEEQLRLLDGEPDGHNRLTMVTLFLKRGSPDPQLLARCLADKYAKIRLYALERQERLPKTARASLETFLFDPSQAIREYARFLLKRDGRTDFTEAYRSQVRTTPSAGAVAGLGETGDASDAPAVAALTDAGSRRLAKAAINALGRLDAAGYASLLYAHLFKPATSKSAFAALRKYGIVQSCREYYEEYLRSGDAVLRRRLLILISLARGWEKLPILIRLYPETREMLIKTLTPSLGQSSPTAEQMGDIRSALQERPIPEKQLLNMLEFFLPKA